MIESEPQVLKSNLGVRGGYGSLSMQQAQFTKQLPFARTLGTQNSSF